MEHRQGHLSFQGVRVRYSMSLPSGEISHRILLLSGAVTTAFNWRKLLPEFEEMGCLCVCVDLPGCGREVYAPGMLPDADRAAGFVWGLLDEIDRATGAGRATWHLFAQGAGCRTVLAMHDQYPDSVRSIVNISPVFDAGCVRRLIGHDRAGWYKKNIASREGFRKLAERLAGYPLDAFVMDRMRQDLLYPDLPYAVLSTVKEPALPVHADFCPCMAIWGGHDELIGTTPQLLDKYLPGCEPHVMKNAGHFLTETHSRALRDYLRGWLKYMS